MTINKNEYLNCPCRVASIPYWKAKTITVPDGMSIVHQDDLNEIFDSIHSYKVCVINSSWTLARCNNGEIS